MAVPAGILPKRQASSTRDRDTLGRAGAFAQTFQQTRLPQSTHLKRHGVKKHAVRLFDGRPCHLSAERLRADLVSFLSIEDFQNVRLSQGQFHS